MKTILSGACALFLLAGCVTFGPSKVLQAYDGPARPESQLAQLDLYDTHANPSNLIEKLWEAGVTSIDGTPTAGYGWAHLAPGKHRLKMFCLPHDPKIKRAENVEVEVDLKAGKTYRPWSGTVATVIRGSGAQGAIPGTMVGQLAAGFCRPYVDDHMADVVR